MPRNLSNLLSQYETDMGIVCDCSNCTCQAAYTVQIHLIDHCEGHPNRAYLMCASCARDAVQQTKESITRMKKAVRQQDMSAWLECTTCGKRINTLRDMVVMSRLTHA